jgi:hypothetical protein
VTLVDGPWADAQVGQFARYRGRGGATMTRRVVAVGQEEVTLEVTASAAGRSATRTVKMLRRVPLGRGPYGIPAEARWSEQVVRVNGRPLDCRVASWAGPGDESRRAYLSSQVPGGLVRSARVGLDGAEEAVMELTAFGREQRPESRPAAAE